MRDFFFAQTNEPMTNKLMNQPNGRQSQPVLHSFYI